jgi:hypothetical protein
MRSLFKISLTIYLLKGTLSAIGTQFLAIPLNAYEYGLGQHPISRYCITANPAALSLGSTGTGITISLGSWLQDVRVSSVNFRGTPFDGFVNVGIRYISLDGIEYRTAIPTIEPVSFYSAYGTAVDGTYAKKFNSYNFGFSLRLIHMQVYTESSGGAAVDFGIIKHLNDRVVVGGAVLNLGAMSKLLAEEPELPMRLLSGLGFSYQFGKTSNQLMVSAEYSSKVNGNIFRLAHRVQWTRLAFNASVQYSNNYIDIGSGFDLTFGIYKVRYGFRTGNADLGMAHIVDVSIRIP